MTGYLLAFLLLAETSALGLPANAQSRPAPIQPSPIMVLEISGTELTGRCGEVKLKSTLINVSTFPVVIAPHDTKDPDAAYIYTNWTVLDDLGQAVPMQQLSICPVRPQPAPGKPWFYWDLKNKDVVTLQPDQHYDFGVEDPTLFLAITGPGKYTVTRTFFYEPPRLKSTRMPNGSVIPSSFGVANLSPAKLSALRRAVPFSVVSNPLMIELTSGCKDYSWGPPLPLPPLIPSSLLPPAPLM